MRLFNKNENMDNILKDYYKSKENHLKHNIPSLPVINIIKISETPGKKLLINFAFSAAITIMSGIFILKAGSKTEMELLLEKVIENTDIIEHIRSGSINMFEILSKSLM
jgi:hypothetical protein